MGASFPNDVLTAMPLLWGLVGLGVGLTGASEDAIEGSSVGKLMSASEGASEDLFMGELLWSSEGTIEGTTESSSVGELLGAYEGALEGV